MKTHRRLALALFTLVAPLSLAAAPRPADSGTNETPQSAEPRERAADAPKRAPLDGKDLERRVQALESEVAHLRSQDEAQNQQFGEPITAP